MQPGRWSLGVAFIALAGAFGCAKTQEQAPAPPPPNVVNVTAVNYAFTLPDTVPSGATTFRLVNHGTELHHLQVVRLLQGRTLDSLAAALKHPGPFPAWVQLVGGPNAAAPNDTTVATVDLPAGHYAVLCLIPGADNMPHFTKGMIRPLEVRYNAATVNPTLPAADLSVTLKDYQFDMAGTVAAGTHSFGVTNDGPQPHELVLAQLAPGKTLQDLMTWVDGGMHGAPPGKPIGGVTGLAVGRHAQFTATLTPGTYGFICFFPAPDGKDHAHHGMLKQFTVS